MEHRISSSEDEYELNNEEQQQERQQQPAMMTEDDDEDTIVTDDEADDHHDNKGDNKSIGDILCEKQNQSSKKTVVSDNDNNPRNVDNALANLIDVTEKVGNAIDKSANLSNSVATNGLNKRKSTGRLAMITEKLAKKQQNGAPAFLTTNTGTMETNVSCWRLFLVIKNLSL